MTLSVLIPHFRDPAGLRMSLRSIECQTWKGSLQAIVYDDGSPREVLDEVRSEIASSSVNVVLLEGGTNRGRPFARNALLKAADGKYTAWLDAGDEWYPNKLALQFDAIYRSRLLRFESPVWVTCNFDWKWEGGAPRVRKQRVDGNQLNNLLTARCGAYLWTVLGETQTFRDTGLFDDNLPRLQDLDFFLRFIEKGGMLILPSTAEPLCVYHKSDIGRDGETVLRCFQYVLDKHAPLLMQRSRLFRRNRRHDVYVHAARFALNNGRRDLVAKYLLGAALQNPVRLGKMLKRTGGKL